MEFLAERSKAEENQDATYTMSISKNLKDRPLSVDGLFTIIYYDIWGKVIRSYYISHKDQCSILVPFAQDQDDAHRVVLSRYG